MDLTQWDVDHRPECGAANTGYRALWAAVMKQALEDYWRGISLGFDREIPAKQTQTYRDYASAVGWLFGPDRGVGSLPWVCDHLGYDIDFVRFKARTRSVWRDERIAKNRERAAKNHATRKARGRPVRITTLPEQFTVYDVIEVLGKKGTVARAWITSMIKSGQVASTGLKEYHPTGRRMCVVYRQVAKDCNSAVGVAQS